MPLCPPREQHELLAAKKLDQTVQETVATWNYFQSVDRPQNRELVKHFKTRYGKQRAASDPMEAAHVGVHLWTQAVKEAGDDSVAKIRQAVRQQSFDVPGGLVRLDPETEHATKAFRVGRITKDSRFEVIYSPESPITPVPYPKISSADERDAFLMDLHLG